MIDVDEKMCGLLVPVFALVRPGDLGIGDTWAVRDAVDFCARHGLSVLQVLPINETGGDHSPYNAISSVALDPVLLTVQPDTVPGLKTADFDRLQQESGFLQLDRSSVHYKVVKRLKLDLLRCGWENFRAGLEAGSGSDEQDFLAFEVAHAEWLEPYTLFRTLVEIHGGNACWPQWKEEYQSPESADAALASHPDAGRLADDRRFRAFVQWLAFRQWTGLRRFADSRQVRLFGDIPFGVSRYSCDVWAQRELFDLDWSGGAPPEPLFQADDFTRKWGQNWGIPLYRWEAHEADNYRWWRRRVERLTDVFHYFRIDHVLGFFRVYAFPWIPERNWEFRDLSEEEAEELCDGRLPRFIPRPDYPEELGELNAEFGKRILEVIMDAAGENDVVAEDLGAVPDYVRPLLHELGIPGFAIPIFERNEEDRSFKDKSELHPLSVATYGTHDHMPLALYYEDLVSRWLGPDGHEAWLELNRLMRFLGRTENEPPREFTDELARDFMRALLESPCWLAVNMVSDMLGTREQFNAPGVSSDENWSRRLEKPLDAYRDDSRYAAKIQWLAELISETGRLPGVKAPVK